MSDPRVALGGYFLRLPPVLALPPADFERIVDRWPLVMRIPFELRLKARFTAVVESLRLTFLVCVTCSPIRRW